MTHWNQAISGCYSDMSVSCPLYIKQTVKFVRLPTLSDHVLSNTPTPCCFTPEFLRPTNEGLPVTYRVCHCFNRKLVNSPTGSTTETAYSTESILGHQCIFVRADAHKEKGPSVCLTFKMLSPNHFSKLHKTFWHL